MYKPSPAINTNMNRATMAVLVPDEEKKTKNPNVLNNIRIVSRTVEAYNQGNKNLWRCWGFYRK